MPQRRLHFPRLKSYSQSPTVPANLLHSNLTTLQPSTSYNHSGNLRQNTTAISRSKEPYYHYINKSPHYFKHRQLPINPNRNVTIQTDTDQSVEAYLEAHSRGLNKEFLMEIARSRVKTIQKMRKKEEGHGKRKVSIADGQGTILDQLHRMKESKYENFRPMRFPMERAIHSHKKHPIIA